MISNLDTEVAPSSAPTPEVDPWDIRNIRIDMSNLNTRAATTKLAKVPVRKPSKHEFIRTHREFRLDAYMIRLKEEREDYLVFPHVVPQLDSRVHSLLEPHTLYLCINKQKVIFVWPVKNVDDERPNDWLSSAHEAAEIAQDKWTRVTSNLGLGSYETTTANAEYGEPDWLGKQFGEFLKIAFKDNAIQSPDHKLILQLMGD